MSGKPGLDDVDPEAGQLSGDLDLLVGVEGDPGRLLAVSEGAVEDPYLVLHVCSNALVGLRPVSAGRPRRPTG